MIITNEKKSEDALSQVDVQHSLRNRSFLVVPWKAELASIEGVHHACGQMCVQQAVERFMSGTEIFQEAAPSVDASPLPDNRHLHGMLLDQPISDMDLDAIVNKVAESAVQSVVDSEFMHLDHEYMNSDFGPLAFDVDEEGELSAVLSPARPKSPSAIKPRPEGSSHAAA